MSSTSHGVPAGSNSSGGQSGEAPVQNSGASQRSTAARQRVVLGTKRSAGHEWLDPSQCSSGQCASDGTSMYCVEPCTVGQCPMGFGCTITSGTMGVCWPGYNDGSGSSGGGCDSGGAPGLFGLSALAGLLALRRRRARA